MPETDKQTQPKDEGGVALPPIVGPFRIRRLIDGRYVAEQRLGWIFRRWEGIDLQSPGFTWMPGSRFYKDCIGTREQCINALALFGLDWPNKERTDGEAIR